MRAEVGFVLVDFRSVKIGAIIRKSSLSLFYLFIIPPYVVFFFTVLPLLLLFLFLFDSSSLFDLLVENAFHLSAFFLKLGLLAVVELFREGSANVALLLEFLGLFRIIHVRSVEGRGVSEKKKGDKRKSVEND